MLPGKRHLLPGKRHFCHNCMYKKPRFGAGVLRLLVV